MIFMINDSDWRRIAHMRVMFRMMGWEASVWTKLAPGESHRGPRISVPKLVLPKRRRVLRHLGARRHQSTSTNGFKFIIQNGSDMKMYEIDMKLIWRDYTRKQKEHLCGFGHCMMMVSYFHVSHRLEGIWHVQISNMGSMFKISSKCSKSYNMLWP